MSDLYNRLLVSFLLIIFAIAICFLGHEVLQENRHRELLKAIKEAKQ